MIKYFIMLRHPGGFPLPIVNDNDVIVLFDSIAALKKEADSNPFAGAYGYEVMEWEV